MTDRFQSIRDIGTDNEEIRNIESRIKNGKHKIQVMQEETYKNDYRLGKFETEINRLEVEIKNRRNDIKKIAEKSKIEWFRPKWMKNKILNKIEEIRYWNN